MVETHHDLPASEFEHPGATHHMLFIRLDVKARLRYGWDAVRYDGPVRSGDLALVPAGQATRVQLVGRYAETVRFGYTVARKPDVVSGDIPSQACL